MTELELREREPSHDTGGLEELRVRLGVERDDGGARHDHGIFVADAHERGLRVNVWTVNAPVTITRLAAAGVDGFITDVPDVARRALAIG